jgi:putative ABC transport system permease protein
VPLVLPGLSRHERPLERNDQVYFDLLSRKEFGPREPGTVTEAGRRKVVIARTFELGTGFSADGCLLVGEQAYVRIFPGRSTNLVSFGLVTLEAGADPDEVARRLRERLPSDVQVLTRQEISDRERNYWLTKTSVGVIFGLGVVVALIVGATISYQVLASDISARVREYATLRAMGYGKAYLAGVVFTQALVLAVLGFLPGWGLAVVLHQFTAAQANIPMELPGSRALAVFAATLGMCTTAALASVRKVFAADPAELF